MPYENDPEKQVKPRQEPKVIGPFGSIFVVTLKCVHEHLNYVMPSISEGQCFSDEHCLITAEQECWNDSEYCSN